MKTELPEKTLFEKLTTRGYKLNWKERLIDRVAGISAVLILVGTAVVTVVLPILVAVGLMVAIIKVCWFVIFQWH